MKNKLKHPFESLQETQLLSIGLLFLVLFSIIAYYTNARFDGVLDLHFVPSISLHQPLMDNIANTISLSLFLFILAKYVNKRSRLIDIIAIALISRIPLYFGVVFNIGQISTETTNHLMEHISDPEQIFNLPALNLTVLALSSLFALAAMFLVCYLVYKGFKIATNAKKKSHILLLIPSVIFAEILSKFLVTLY